MGGNLEEWVADYYSDKYNKPGDRTKRVLRGGSWNYEDRANMSAADRFGNSPDDHFSNVGFRCARTAD